MLDVYVEQLRFLPEYTAHHVLLTLMSLGAGISVSVPLGILAARVRVLQTPILIVASIIQTFPALAILALMAGLLGQIGVVPAFIALVLYSMLPILRNTVTGLEGVDPNVVEAARGIGMTDNQILFRVRLPLAAPVIIAGIRTSTVWTVGMGTLATIVGATSLGNYIFSGLQTMNRPAIYLGCLSSAVLAIILDSTIRLMEVSLERRSRGLLTVSLVILASVLAGGLAPMAKATFFSEEGTRYVVGSKGFTEQYVIARLMAETLRDAGLNVDVRENLGSVVIFEAATNGQVDCYLDYSGTAWANYMNREDNPGREEVREQVTQWLEEEQGLTVLGGFGFENLYAVAMREEKAQELGIETIEDLAEQASSLSCASDLEFFSRPEWNALRETYELRFRETRSLDAALMYQAVNRDQVDVIVAYSTDGRIAAYDLVLLEDPREALLPYDGLLVLSEEAAEDARVVEALTPLVGAITSDMMREANKLVDVEGKSLSEAVRYLENEIANGESDRD